ncbi:MAG TPA: alpha/beta hydrolase [Candidatus Tumulicola sp.]
MHVRSTAHVGGVEVEFERLPGANEMPTLVFLHEGLGSIRNWREFPAQLCQATGAPGLVYSRYGNGFSSALRASRPTSYMHDEALETLPALLDMLSIRSTAIVGHSDGASIGIIFGAEFPERVRCLVLEAPHVFVEDLSVRSIADMRAEYERRELRNRFAKYHADPDATFYGWNDIWLSPQFASWNIESSVDRLAAPALVIQGFDDRYGTIAQVDAICRRHSATDALLLSKCGHAPHRDRPDVVQSTASRWILEKVRSA